MHYSRRVGNWLAAALLAITPWAVDAAGLGRLSVQSSLGQPFHAEIDLVAVPKDEIGSLSVRLAPVAAYQQAGLQYNNVVAGLALRIERRPNGEPYVKVTSSRPVNEFVVDVLIDLSWASGRIMREYRVLLDPPGAPTTASAADSRSAPSAPAAIETPARVAAPAARSLPVEASAANADTPGTYGPVKRGETLSQIAREVRPEGVSVEQMLIGLYRSNPDVFIRKNMNLMRSGKILRVPERSEIAAIPHEEALKEYRAQVADWNSYRQSLAQHPAPAPEGGSATSGRISARVEDTTAGETRDVVRVSKGEPPGAAKEGGKEASEAQLKERLRALEEEIIAREKAVSEANERIAQLEKTVKDMQRLMEIKSAGLAAAQQKAEGAAKPEPAATEPVETKPTPAAPPVADAAKPKPKPAAKPAPPPPLPPEPSLVEALLANPLHLAGIGLVIVAGAALWLMRRRRSEGSRAAQLFSPAGALGTEPQAVGAAAGGGEAAGAVASARDSVPDVDPVEEARIYVMHGRDAQAEAILKEGLAKDPKREAIYVKLLEIYAARQDQGGFAKYARELHKVTGGKGENWLKAAAMGYALDAANPLYAAGKDAAATEPAADASRAADLDLDLDIAHTGSSTPDVNLDAAPEAHVSDGTAAQDFQLELPAPEAPAPQPARNDIPPLDFHIELPPAGNAGSAPSAKAERAPSFTLPEIDLDLDQKRDAADASAAKDAHWYDVQTKFDLAKAYEEMGDKAGARQILEEVIREGDAEQQAQAQQLLSKLS